MGQKKAKAQATCSVLPCFNFGSGLFYHLFSINEVLKTGHSGNSSVEASIQFFLEKTVLWGMDFPTVGRREQKELTICNQDYVFCKPWYLYQGLPLGSAVEWFL